MTKSTFKFQRYLTLFGIFCLGFNGYELIGGKQTTSQGLIFIMECLLGIGLIYLPNGLAKFGKIRLPQGITNFYWFFLLLSVFLGTSLHLIILIPFWDKVLHLVSPMLLTTIGYGLASSLLAKVDQREVSPWLYLLFGLAFAGLCGVFWEFWEFICDSLGQMNLQRYNGATGEPLIGRLALMDTMGDLFVNTLGALLMGIYAFVQAKGEAHYFERYRIKKIA